jgi:hypothetical protein
MSRTKIAGSGSIGQWHGSGSVPKCHGSTTTTLFYSLAKQLRNVELERKLCAEPVLPGGVNGRLPALNLAGLKVRDGMVFKSANNFCHPTSPRRRKKKYPNVTPMISSVADPGCLSRILIFTHSGSRISDPKTVKKRGVKKNCRQTFL